MARLCVGALLHAVVSECLHLRLVGLLGGAPDVVADELLGCSRQGRGLLMGVLLVPSVWVLWRDSCVVARLLAPLFFLRLLLWLLYGNLVAASGL